MPGNKGFRYVYGTSQITNILLKLRTLGRPDRLTFPYIRDTWLLKNKQYSDVIVLLRDMELIDISGNPTELYAQYQNPSIAKNALATGIHKAYPELFKAYPHAQSLPKKDLEGYFRQQTGKAGSVLGKMVGTFTTLCKEADFTGTAAISAEEQLAPEYVEPVSKQSSVTVEPKVQVNIEIHISPEMTEENIESIFKHMKHYLLSDG